MYLVFPAIEIVFSFISCQLELVWEFTAGNDPIFTIEFELKRLLL
jgi:hypothetical protein